MNYPKITIAGDLGSGKSTIAQKISKKLSIKSYSTGDIQRKIAEKYDKTTLELNEYMKTHPEIDEEIDNFTISLSEKEESFIIDSRMAWHFIEGAFNLFLKVRPEVAAQRIFDDQIRISETYKNVNEALNNILERKLIENDRFKQLYGVDCENIANYDMVVNTSNVPVDAIVNIILSEFDKWKNDKHTPYYWINPKLLIPTQDVIVLGRDEGKQVYDSMQCNGFNYEFPVLAINIENISYIYDGHKRTSAAIMHNIPLVPIVVIATDDEKMPFNITAKQFVKTESIQNYIYNWESCHRYNFSDYINENFFKE